MHIIRPQTWLPPLYHAIGRMSSTQVGQVAAVLALMGYAAAGLYTELQLLATKPLPSYLMEDFNNVFSRAYLDASQGQNPYGLHRTIRGFHYPPPALLVVWPFTLIPATYLRPAAFLTLNVTLLALMLVGIARRYGYSFDRIWWWFPLAFAFAPVLELLHVGQINLITAFGIFLMFMYEKSMPFLAGLGLSLAIATKVSPLSFVAYLVVRRNRSAIGWTMALLGIAVAASSAWFGLHLLGTYMDVFDYLLRTFREGTNPQALVSILHSQGWIEEGSWRQVQQGLTMYLATVFVISGIIAFVFRQPEPFFVVLSLGTMITPNVMWYHHYVFILLPLLVWMAWSRLHPAVVLCCFIGLTIIQLDRWYWTHGLLTHVFAHLNILGILAWQVIYTMRARSQGPSFKNQA